MKMTALCVCSAAMVQAMAQKPPDATVVSPAEAPNVIQPFQPQRLPGQGAGQAKKDNPAMSTSRRPDNKPLPVVPGSPPSLGLCDGS